MNVLKCGERCEEVCVLGCGGGEIKCREVR